MLLRIDAGFSYIWITHVIRFWIEVFRQTIRADGHFAAPTSHSLCLAGMIVALQPHEEFVPQGLRALEQA
ncbi:MAG TPA: hypothetical protein DDZ67_00810 [Xanthomonadaceae bacterium]|nr:hypothetical protein [Xanthomonadaceae bacterium]